MDLSTAFLAVVPSLLAMLVEHLSLIDESTLRSNAARAFRSDDKVNLDPDLLDNIAKFSAGAVEVTGLFPTLIACVSSCFAILHEYPSPFWPFVFYLLIFLFLISLVLKFLSGQTYFDIVEKSQEVSLFGSKITLPLGKKTLGYFIYAANLIFIAFVIFTYCILGHPSVALMKWFD